MHMTTLNKIPKHIAIIMDGNRRWARERGLPDVEGHRQGVQVIKPLIRHAFDLGVEVLTFWAFSTKNFKRDQNFLKDIFDVFRETLDKREWFEEIRQMGGKVNIIGNPTHFPKDILKRVQGYLDEQNNGTTKYVNFALEYEGRDEILRAIKKLAKEGKNMADIEFDNIADNLDTAGMPDPDLMIRTGGEIRLSGYLLWQIADSELYFTDTYWPDFTPDKLDEAIQEYSSRDRRFGK